MRPAAAGCHVPLIRRQRMGGIPRRHRGTKKPPGGEPGRPVAFSVPV